MRQRVMVFLTAGAIVLFLVVAALVLPRIIGEVTYPLAYEDLIVRYAKDRQLDPFLVAAVIYSESRYRPTAVSPVGARGLMQLMPATAQGIARKLNAANFRTTDLFDPETNINFGTFHLQGLNGRYDSNVDGVLAGYNGGGSVGDRYVAGQGGIPLETQRYVVNVKAAIEHYRALYEDRLRLAGPSIESISEGAAPNPTLATQIINNVITFLRGGE